MATRPAPPRPLSRSRTPPPRLSRGSAIPLRLHQPQWYSLHQAPHIRLTRIANTSSARSVLSFLLRRPFCRDLAHSTPRSVRRVADFEQPQKTANNACLTDVPRGRPRAGLHHAGGGWLRGADSRYERNKNNPFFYQTQNMTHVILTTLIITGTLVPGICWPLCHLWTLDVDARSIPPFPLEVLKHAFAGFVCVRECTTSKGTQKEISSFARHVGHRSSWPVAPLSRPSIFESLV